jgi:hypothetical protein
VLSPEVLSTTSPADDLILRVANRREANSFWVHDTRPIGGTFEGEARPFLLFSEPRVEDDLDTFVKAVGWTPIQDNGLAAMCNRKEDHRILGEMALWLSERLSGVVDLGGYVPAISELGLPSVNVGYSMVTGDGAYCTVVGPAALRAWLASPKFRMVK